MIPKLLIPWAFSLLFCGCSGTDGTALPESFDPAIEAYVASFNFPEQQEIRLVLEVPEEDVQVFTVEYGNPNDCISGCFYSRGEGLRHGDKIGWISINDFESIDLPDAYIYDVDSSDVYLVTDEFYDLLTKAHGWIEHISYMYLLAGDEDTPYELLFEYAERIGSTPFMGFLGRGLLSNSVVQTDVTILTMLASLPTEPEEYADIRANAEKYLDQL